MKLHRVFVEWFDADRPGWGGYVSSLDPDFQKALVEGFEAFGHPTKVEFRAAEEGWVGPTPCEDCERQLEDCFCDQSIPEGK